MEISAARLIILAGVIAASVCHDIRAKRIPNRVIIFGALAGLASSVLPGSIGLAQSLGGLGMGLAMLMPLYALRAMGAGDVKLMAVAGAFLGIETTFFSALFAFAAGGLLALVYSAYAGAFGQTMRNLKMFIFHSAVRVAGGRLPNAGDMALGGERMPYSLAIAGGVGTYLAVRFYTAGVLV
ncbi:A24 family peptidase [Noviherbaspirillum autotrophicum]|uniref:Prepilin type IV endopeptidase peptidase domain-containing protein n=1 Tax=Noviherbaspirillum autotrophicum TaxID=709839 RepID=A0A0C2BJM9_9BURK|nr:A24 family peptidase [Noviherbaspirillum autotrophicum]KIF80219.1 hypothetical protein TSA66_04400 [Noviherbaspirillum autotrophicum]